MFQERHLSQLSLCFWEIIKNNIDLCETKHTLQIKSTPISCLISETDVLLNDPRLTQDLYSLPWILILAEIPDTIHRRRSFLLLFLSDSETCAPCLIWISELAQQSDFLFKCPPLEAINWNKFGIQGLLMPAKWLPHFSRAEDAGKHNCTEKTWWQHRITQGPHPRSSRLPSPFTPVSWHGDKKCPFHSQKCQLSIIPYELTIIIINVDNVSSELLIKDQTTVNRLFSEEKYTIIHGQIRQNNWVRYWSSNCVSLNDLEIRCFKHACPRSCYINEVSP